MLEAEHAGLNLDALILGAEWVEVDIHTSHTTNANVTSPGVREDDDLSMNTGTTLTTQPPPSQLSFATAVGGERLRFDIDSHRV